MNKLLYINNQLVDLFPNTVIAQTLQAFEVGKLGSVRLNYTNQIKLPKTGNNRQILGFADSTKSSTSFPYTSGTARYVDNGLEVIRNGIATIKEAGNDFVLNIISGPAGFFNYIRTKKLWDLDFSDINSAWTDPIRDSLRNATTGIVAPLVDDGRLVYTAPNIENNGSIIKHPWIYYHTVIDKIFSSAGYTKSGAIFSDAAYLALAMPLSLTYAPGFIAAKGFSAAAPGNQSIVDPAVYVDVTFDQVSFNGDDGFYDGTDTYAVVNPDSTGSYFFAIFYAQLTITVSGGTVDIVMELSGTGPSTDSEINVGSGTYALNVTNSGMANGNQVKIKIIRNTGNPTITVTSGVFYNVPRTGINGDLLITCLPGGYTYFNLLFEDINQIDFLTDFCVRFNVKMTEFNGVIVCKTMDEILAGSADQVAWTTKRIGPKETVRYAYNGLAQNNCFTYQTDELTPDLPDDYAKGCFTIANVNIPETQDIFQSFFAMSEMASFSGLVFMAKMDMEPSAANYGRNLGIRLLFLRDNLSTEPNVIYDSPTARSDYKVAYFIDARQTRSMHWQYFVDGYYTGFAARLQKAKAVVREYRLNDLDIHSFDQLKLIHDNSETFIVTKINQYQSGKGTQVELFKV